VRDKPFRRKTLSPDPSPGGSGSFTSIQCVRYFQDRTFVNASGKSGSGQNQTLKEAANRVAALRNAQIIARIARARRPVVASKLRQL